MARTGSLVVAVAMGSLLMGCGGGGGRKHGPAVPRWCKVVDVAYGRLMVPSDLTFEAIVEDPRWSGDELAAAGTAALMRGDGSLAPFEELFEHLAARVEAESNGSTAPDASSRVRAEARRIDRALEEGDCR